MKKPTVTLISGLPGSGKTSLLNHLLRNRGEKSMGVILNSLDETNDDDADDDEREPVDHEQIAEQSGESFVELTDGCICCSLREELLADVWQLSQQGLHDSILIEAAGVAEPASVAEVFLYVDENGDSLADVATLDTLVTVVNAETFLADYNSTDELRDLGIGLDDDDSRDLVRLMVDQIEFANVVVLNKSDLVSPEDKGLIMNLLRHLNPEAKVLLAEHGEVPIEDVVNTGRFPDASNGGTSEESPANADADSSSSSIFSFYYRANRPFHPQRLWDFWMEHELAPGILRSRGNLWLATRNSMSGFWSQAGQVMAAEPAGKWWAETDRN
jgi:G3E family GTPase